MEESRSPSEKYFKNEDTIFIKPDARHLILINDDKFIPIYGKNRMRSLLKGAKKTSEIDADLLQKYAEWKSKTVLKKHDETYYKKDDKVFIKLSNTVAINVTDKTIMHGKKNVDTLTEQIETIDEAALEEYAKYVFSNLIKNQGKNSIRRLKSNRYTIDYVNEKLKHVEIDESILGAKSSIKKTMIDGKITRMIYTHGPLRIIFDEFESNVAHRLKANMTKIAERDELKTLLLKCISKFTADVEIRDGKSYTANVHGDFADIESKLIE